MILNPLMWDGDHVPKTARTIPYNAFFINYEWDGRTDRVFIWMRRRGN